MLPPDSDFYGGPHFVASNADEFHDFVNQEVREMREEMVKDACENLAALIGAYESLCNVVSDFDGASRDVVELLGVLNQRFRVILDILDSAGVLS
jgi:hypothetical protein